MTIPNYCTIKGQLLLGVPFYSNRGYKGDPHYNLIIDVEGSHHRVAINTLSKDKSEICFLLDNYFNHPLIDQLRALKDGVHPNAARLDYWRDKRLVDIRRFTPIPFDTPGNDNDLNDLYAKMLTTVVDPARLTPCEISGRDYTETRDAYPPISPVTAYAIGSVFAPGTPGQGVHDIHMNQGNLGEYMKDNGTYTDGALIVEVENGFRAFFAAFQTQRLPTDNKGNPLPDAKPILKVV
ncbi:MAG: YukJ family protein [Geobacteraceae bacterium]|nr:YukJ family protein [Geobacteraceae bacterium]